MARKDDDVSKILERWAATDLKLEVIVFFRNNPGVIETVEGLAHRLGASPEALRKEIEDHISLGVLREQKLDTTTVVMYDRMREADLLRLIEEEIQRRSAAGAAV